MLEIKPITAQRAVTAAGTPEKVKETPEDLQNEVITVTFRAHADNAGNLYVTNADDRASASTAGYILAPGETLSLDVHDLIDGFLDLAKIWVDAANSGDGFSYIAIEVLR